MSDTTPIRGVIPPLLTPIDRAGRVDEAGLRAVVRWLIGQGVHGLFVGGSSGEGPLLSALAYRRLMEVVFDEAGGKVILLPGAMDTSASRVIEKIALLRAIGYRHYVVTPTFYIPLPAVADQLRLFEACHSASGGEMELVPYNIPQFAQAPIAIETMVELARRGWVRVCKDSSTDESASKKLRDAGKAVGLGVLTGDDGHAADALLAGCVGGVNITAHCEPKTQLQLYAAAQRGDSAEAHRLQRRVDGLIAHVMRAGDCFIAGSKYWVGKQIGRDLGDPLSPLPPLTAEQRQSIDRFAEAGL